MNRASLLQLFNQVRKGDLSADEAVQRLRHLPFEDLGFAKLDHHRLLRQGMPEVIFSEGKSPAQVGKIFCRLAAHGGNILATRATEEQYKAVCTAFEKEACGADTGVAIARGSRMMRWSIPVREQHASSDRRAPRGSRVSKRAIPNDAKAINCPAPEYHPLARAIALRRDRRRYGKGVIAIISAGTSDIPVAEEAVVTAELMGNEVQHLYDVGVAGIHRLLAHQRVLAKARVIIVCAGMEGALPSVVGGLVGVPVIAVPTSVGYGAAFEGLAALLGMLNSCASNVSVVNIDNGFGAAYVASLINRR